MDALKDYILSYDEDVFDDFGPDETGVIEGVVTHFCLPNLGDALYQIDKLIESENTAALKRAFAANTQIDLSFGLPLLEAAKLHSKYMAIKLNSQN
ncbi:hypothetical protein [uncultured Litoreibacter sp.]|uniref:hypothetical protein n=1 Tax=uncultured Litoreibacter sp. TaxID=1392394 RepID=UPI00262BAFF4|nr:hypothetical protein [uncultured Litoreibacter sp.]